MRDERASKDPEDASLAHAISGNSLHNFALENLFVDNEIAGVGRTPWRSIGERNGVGILRLALPFRQAQGRARSGRQRDTVFNQTETLLNFFDPCKSVLSVVRVGFLGKDGRV